MGIMNQMLGATQIVGQIGQIVKGTSEVFHANESEAQKLHSERFLGVQEAYRNETTAAYSASSDDRFGVFVNGLNRLPRPLLAFGTIALFGYAMVDPDSFSIRMQGLNEVPEPLWWLLGAIVSFYFGARELYYLRNPSTHTSQPVTNVKKVKKRPQSEGSEQKTQHFTEQSSLGIHLGHKDIGLSLQERLNRIKTEIKPENQAVLEWVELQEAKG